MASLFDTEADKLPLNLQVLRKLLHEAWDDDSLSRTTWLKQIDAFGGKPAATVFESLLGAGVFELDGEGKYFINRDA